MKFAVVNRINGFLDIPSIGYYPRVDYFHSEMFHGLAMRAGKVMPWIDTAFLPARPSEPLMLTKNAFQIAPLFEPEKFVVSQKLRDELSDIPGIDFFPVEFSKIFSYPYGPGDFSFTKDCQSDDAQEFALSREDDRSLLPQVGAYYELLMHRHQDVCGKYADLREVGVDVTWSTCSPHVVEPVSERLLRDYGVLWNVGGIIISEIALSRLDPVLDRDYFEVVTATI